MSKRTPRLAALWLVVSSPILCAAAGLTISDTCSRILQGNVSGTNPDPVSVAGDGSLAATGFVAGSYVAGVGLCDPLPAGAKPLCTLSASNTRIAKGGSVTLYAKCPASTNSYAWSGPAAGSSVPATSTTPSLTLSFPAAGAFTYAVAGSSSTGTVGTPSAPITILVGNSTAPVDVPNCILTASPGSIVQNSTANLLAVCHPEATSYAWEADAGAPAAPSAGLPAATLTFPTGGAFTYKVVGSNSAGPGPKSSATVNVTASTVVLPAFLNGSFEIPVVGAYSLTMTTPGWTPYIGNPATFASNVSGAYLQSQGWAGAPDGAQVAMYPSGGGLRQSVSINAPGTYHLTFSAMAHTNDPTITVTVLMDGAQVGTHSLVTAAFTSITFNVPVSAAGSHLFDFTTLSQIPQGYIFIDNIRFTP